MKTSLLRILACPACGGDLSCPDMNVVAGNVESGELHCSGCPSKFPIVRGIPRFVPADNYARSFGIQWNLFREEQLDSILGTAHSHSRFFGETQWNERELVGKRVLEIGCGAGRFLEVAAPHASELVGVDLSHAVDSAAQTVGKWGNTHLVQASVYALPFKPGQFDLCYSIGVMQHTPEPLRAVTALPQMLRSGGRAAVTVYERRPWTLLNAKYLIRPLTRRLPTGLLLVLVRIAVAILFPITDLLFRIPILGRVLSFFVPIADYSWASDLTYLRRYRAVVLDTFDMLAPAFDRPFTRDELERGLKEGGLTEMRRVPNSGLTVVGVKG